MAGYFRSLNGEIRQAQAMMPVISARKMDTMEMKNVDLSPVRNRGRYSKMILKLKSASIGASLFTGSMPGGAGYGPFEVYLMFCSG
jgi:hypothetical protein